MITIEKATVNEARLITDLAVKSFHESHGHSAPAADIESYASTKLDLKTVEEELTDPGNIFHVIYYRGHAAGFSKIILNRQHSLIESAAITKFERLYLLKEFYDLKLGRTLFEFITGISKKANQDGIWLFVWMENHRAIAFYKKCGFKIIGSSDFRLSETHSNPNHVMYLKY